MKKIRYIISVALGVCMLLPGCQDLEEPANNVPSVTTGETPENVTAHRALLTGNITNSSQVTKSYFLVSTSENMKDAQEYVAEWSEDGRISTYVYELERNTTYYYVLCASNGTDEVRGQVRSFTTIDNILNMGSVKLVSWDGESEDLKMEKIGAFLIGGNKLYNEFSNRRIVNNETLWTLPYEVEVPSTPLTMYAYAPYHEEASWYNNYNDIKLSVYTYKYTGTDYLYGSCTGISENNTTANIVMKHALAKVVFQVKKGENNTSEGVLTGLILSNTEGAEALPTSGTLNIVTGEITPDTYAYSEPLRWNDFKVSLDKETPKNMEVLTLPTTRSNIVSLRLEMSDERAYSTDIEVETWEAGKQYTYSVLLNETELIIGQVKVEEWKNTESGDITVNN